MGQNRVLTGRYLVWGLPEPIGRPASQTLRDISGKKKGA